MGSPIKIIERVEPPGEDRIITVPKRMSGGQYKKLLWDMQEGEKDGYMAAVLRQEDSEHPVKLEPIKGFVATKREMMRGPYEDQYFPDGDVYPIEDTRFVATRKEKPRIGLKGLMADLDFSEHRTITDDLNYVTQHFRSDHRHSSVGDPAGLCKLADENKPLEYERNTLGFLRRRLVPNEHGYCEDCGIAMIYQHDYLECPMCDFRCDMHNRPLEDLQAVVAGTDPKRPYKGRRKSNTIAPRINEPSYQPKSMLEPLGSFNRSLSKTSGNQLPSKESTPPTQQSMGGVGNTQSMVTKVTPPTEVKKSITLKEASSQTHTPESAPAQPAAVSFNQTIQQPQVTASMDAPQQMPPPPQQASFQSQQGSFKQQQVPTPQQQQAPQQLPPPAQQQPGVQFASGVPLGPSFFAEVLHREATGEPLPQPSRELFVPPADRVRPPLGQHTQVTTQRLGQPSETGRMHNVSSGSPQMQVSPHQPVTVMPNTAAHNLLELLQDPNYYQHLASTTVARRVPGMNNVPMPVMVNADSSSVGYFAQGTDFMARDARVVNQADGIYHRMNMAEQSRFQAAAQYDDLRMRQARLGHIAPGHDNVGQAMGMAGGKPYLFPLRPDDPGAGAYRAPGYPLGAGGRSGYGGVRADMTGPMAADDLSDDSSIDVYSPEERAAVKQAGGQVPGIAQLKSPDKAKKGVEPLATDGSGRWGIPGEEARKAKEAADAKARQEKNILEEAARIKKEREEEAAAKARGEEPKSKFPPGTKFAMSKDGKRWAIFPDGSKHPMPAGGAPGEAPKKFPAGTKFAMSKDGAKWAMPPDGSKIPMNEIAKYDERSAKVSPHVGDAAAKPKFPVGTKFAMTPDGAKWAIKPDGSKVAMGPPEDGALPKGASVASLPKGTSKTALGAKKAPPGSKFVQTAGNIFVQI